MRSLVVGIVCLIMFSGCRRGGDVNDTVAPSGVKRAATKVKVDGNGHTTEQNNIIDRYARDNEPGSIKHLYVISAYSGQVILYSPVRGKVTSSGKRLSPTTNVDTYGNGNGGHVPINVEAIQDDGTYGTSVEYLFWFSPDGRYHQHYISGGQIVHVADQPLAVKNIIIQIEPHKE